MLAPRLTRDTPSAPTPDQLLQYVEAAWTAVLQGYIQSLFDSMLRRVAALKDDTDNFILQLGGDPPHTLANESKCLATADVKNKVFLPSLPVDVAELKQQIPTAIDGLDSDPSARVGSECALGRRSTTISYMLHFSAALEVEQKGFELYLSPRSNADFETVEIAKEQLHGGFGANELTQTRCGITESRPFFLLLCIELSSRVSIYALFYARDMRHCSERDSQSVDPFAN
ncbi:hypothetical protein TNCV_1006891 [Trichonephila clavipes]|nr:hypothetical protein TNCV_1006891 [Trichonephila clavipes]